MEAFAEIFQFVKGGGSTAVLCLVVVWLAQLYKDERSGRIADAEQYREDAKELARQLERLSERIARGCEK